MCMGFLEWIDQGSYNGLGTQKGRIVEIIIKTTLALAIYLVVVGSLHIKLLIKSKYIVIWNQYFASRATQQ